MEKEKIAHEQEQKKEDREKKRKKRENWLLQKRESAELDNVLNSPGLDPIISLGHRYLNCFVFLSLRLQKCV